MKLTKAQIQVLDNLKGKKRILIYGGSRSGKTFLILFLILWRACKAKSRHLIVRKHSVQVTVSIIRDTLPKVAELMKIKLDINYQSQFIKLENGSEIWWGGLDDKERVDKILGTEYSTIFANEVSIINFHSIETVLTRLAENAGIPRIAFFDQNPPSKKHWTYKLFIDKVNPETNEIQPNSEMYGCFRINPSENEYLPDDYIPNVLMGLSKRKQQRFLHGEFTDSEGVLWTDEIINPYRVLEYPTLQRIVIGVDPAVSANKESDETGIIIAGILNDQIYVIEDCTGKYTPNQWGNLIDRKYKQYGADCVAAEVNNGGDLVESNIRTINRNIRVLKIHASRGKLIRAEPVAGIYEQGRVHHVGSMNNLEDELTTYDGTGDSPNRMDALVIAISELINQNVGIFAINFKRNENT